MSPMMVFIFGMCFPDLVQYPYIFCKILCNNIKTIYFVTIVITVTVLITAWHY